MKWFRNSPMTPADVGELIGEADEVYYPGTITAKVPALRSSEDLASAYQFCEFDCVPLAAPTSELDALPKPVIEFKVCRTGQEAEDTLDELSAKLPKWWENKD